MDRNCDWKNKKAKETVGISGKGRVKTAWFLFAGDQMERRDKSGRACCKSLF